MAAVAVARIDLGRHDGVHPRFGAADVVPFVDPGAGWADPPPAVMAARDRFARWAGADLSLPCFLYGPERSLPEVRRTAFASLRPDTGPTGAPPHRRCLAVGARPVLVAYNLWLTTSGPPADESGTRVLAVARPWPPSSGVRAARPRVAPARRSPGERQRHRARRPFPGRPLRHGGEPGRSRRLRPCSGRSWWGWCPRASSDAAPRHRWAELDLGEDRTIESPLAAKGYQLTVGRG